MIELSAKWNGVTMEKSEEQLNLLSEYIDEAVAEANGSPPFLPIPRKWFYEAMPAYHIWLATNEKQAYCHATNPESILFKGIFIYPENVQ